MTNKATDTGVLAETDGESSRVRVPRRSTLDGFAAHVAQTDGVVLSELTALTRLHVQTRNSVYRLIVLEPLGAAMLIQGGRFFAEATEGQFSGSTLGGSLLKLDWIGVGLSMEFACSGRRIVTSPVRSVQVEDIPSDHRPA